MRRAVFDVRDLRVWIPGILPVLVRRLLLALPIQPHLVVLPRRCLDTRSLREPGQKFLIGFLLSRRAMLRVAALASSVVASIAIVLPLSNTTSTSRCCTQM